MTLPGRHHRGGGPKGPTCGQDVHLELDQACLEIITDLNDLTFKAQSDECHTCDLWTIGTDLHNGSYVKVNTTYGTWWQLDHAGSVLCHKSHVNFGQYGVYQLNVSDQHCHLEAAKDPSNPYLPILWAFFIIGALQLSWFFGKKLYKWKILPLYNARAVNQGSGLLDNDQNAEDVARDEVAEAQQRSRLKRRVRSLDAFRGLAIVIMIFVNYGGGGYSFFAQ